MEAFGQTDLDQRVHRNQSTTSLGKMAFGILQCFLKRAGALGILNEIPRFNQVLRQFQATDKEYQQVEFEIVEEERPPMREIQAYCQKMGIPAA